MALRTHALLATLALSVAIVACDSKEPAPQPVAAKPDSASGEVAQYALMRNAIGWLTDSNIVALAAQVNADAQEIARLETQTWTREPMRFIATEIIRDHARMQLAIDSIARLRGFPSQAPAVAVEMKAPYDSLLNTQIGLPVDEREAQFIDMITKVHERSIRDFGALAGNATDPDLRALLANRGVLMEQTHVARVRLLAAAVRRADSLRQDSLKNRGRGRP